MSLLRCSWAVELTAFTGCAAVSLTLKLAFFLIEQCILFTVIGPVYTLPFTQNKLTFNLLEFINSPHFFLSMWVLLLLLSEFIDCPTETLYLVQCWTFWVSTKFEDSRLTHYALQHCSLFNFSQLRDCELEPIAIIKHSLPASCQSDGRKCL